MIKAVVFDLDDTLYAEREYLLCGFDAVAEFVQQRYGGSCIAKRLLELFEENKHGVFERYILENNLEYTSGSVQGLLQSMVELYRKNKPKSLTLFPDVLPLLEYLKEKSLKIGIITDGRADGQQNKIDALGLQKYADKIILTDDLGGEEYFKPNPKAYELMAAALAIDFDEMIYVGDNPHKDFAIAGHYPIVTVEIARENAQNIHPHDDYLNEIYPKYRVESLAEIEKIIEEEDRIN